MNNPLLKCHKFSSPTHRRLAGYLLAVLFCNPRRVPACGLCYGPTNKLPMLSRCRGPFHPTSPTHPSASVLRRIFVRLEIVLLAATVAVRSMHVGGRMRWGASNDGNQA